MPHFRQDFDSQAQSAFTIKAPAHYDYSMSKPPLKLYSYRRCPFAIRVRLTLHEKGLDFETIEVDLDDMPADLLALHPEGRVPLLVHNGSAVYESSIITEYLDDTFPQAALMPASPTAKMQTRLWTYWCNSQFKPNVDCFKYEKAEGSRLKEIQDTLHADLQKLEQTLTKNAYLLGDTFTLADIHVFPFYRQLARVDAAKELLDSYPFTQKWAQTIANRPAFLKTMAKT